MKKIAIFASGSGTNAENIYKFFANGNRVSVPVVLYDRASAGVKERMAKYPDVQTLFMPASVWKEHPEEILELLRREQIDMVALAGFFRFVPDLLTQAYAGRMLNIHPSLLPAYGGPGMYGDNVHKAVIEAGETVTGATVHYVSDRMDEGEILMQEQVEVSPDDTPESLAAKVHALEYSLYPRAIIAALSRMSEENAAKPADAEPVVEVEVEMPESVVEVEEVKQPQPENPPAIKGVTPPPIPTPAEEWAEALGVDFNPEKIGQGGEAASHPASQAADGSASPTQAPPYGAEAYRQSAYGPPGYGQPQYPQGENPYQQGQGGGEEKMPPTNLIWAILTTIFCCLPLGIVAIIFASQVSGKFYTGDYEGARKASRNAEIWIIVAFVIGVMAQTLYMPLMLLF